ncbi:MAG: phosphatase PAP2 family protein [Bacteroidota bacterium]
MPILTDLNKFWYGRLVYAGLWLILLIFCGKKGRIIALLLIPLLTLSDQVSSSIIKNLIQRSRPCWDENGIPIVPGLRLLVDCGGGYSFPSSHAVNNFGVATFLSYYYRKSLFAFISIAGLIAFTRLYVGVHYPSDAIGGAGIGVTIAFGFIAFWNLVEKKYPQVAIRPKETE